MIHSLIEGGDMIVVINREAKLGPFRARALHAMMDSPGESAIVKVELSESNNIGMYYTELNVNHWDVYSLKDPALSPVLLNYLVPQRD